MEVRIAVMQTDPRLGDLDHNRETIVAAVRDTHCDLMVLPECALSGYGFSQPRHAREASETIPGPTTDALEAVCWDHRRWAVFGLLERVGDRFYNSAVLMGPEGIVGVYRKMHLPFLGVDRMSWPGDLGFPVFDTPLGRIGLLICFDLSFPEAARCLKLGGAQMICVPTNWPMAAEISCVHAPLVRAQENHICVVTANRVGEEGGFRFRGQSRICDADGKVLAVSGEGVGSIAAVVDPSVSDRNRIVIRPGEYEIDRVGSRRPDHYGLIMRGTSQGTLDEDPAPPDT